MYRKHIYLLLTSLLVLTSCTAQAQPLTVQGADISTLLRNEQDGAIYKEYRTPTDAVEILQHQGINLISIRLFVDPDPGEYGASMDLAMVTELGARIKAAGFQFLLSLHYSDTWTNPGIQAKPAAWEGLSYNQLVTKVHDYTRDVVAYLRANDAMPDYVKIGNEINCGMLWPEGNVCETGDWTVLKDFFDAATAGINDGRGNDPMPKTILHVSTVHDFATTQWFFISFLATGVQVDILAESYYPEWQGELQNLVDSLNWMAETYPHDILLAEIADYWQAAGCTPETQKRVVIDVLDVVRNVPGGKGLGAIYWEPTWIWDTSFGYRSCFSDEPEWLDCEMTMAMEVWNAERTYPLESISVDGTVSGTSMDGHASNDYYEAITEEVSGTGKPSSRTSYLEHKWTIEGISDIAGRTLYVEAYKTANSEGDDFVFAWSPDDSSYTDMFTVTKTSDDDTPQTFDLPMSGDTIYVRVTDTDRTGGNNSLDTIYLDAMYIEYGGGPPDTTPPTPDPMTWATVPYATGSSSIAMVATTASDISGVEYYFSCTSGGGHDSGWRDDTPYEDTGLLPETPYTYTVKARDKSANQNQTAESTEETATTESGPTFVTVVNPSFEADGEQTDFTPTGWTWNSSGQRGTSPGGTNGSYFYWHGDGSVLYQTTDHTITTEGIQYELNVDVRNSWQADPKAVIYYLSGSSRIELGSTSLPANGDSWPQWDTLTVSALATAASVGKKVGVEITIGNYPGDYWTENDNVTLARGGAPCVPTSMHVDSIVCGTARGSAGNKYGQVTVTILNNCGNPVSGVDVTGTFTGSFNEQLTETTDGNGVAVLTTTEQAKKPSYTFCVDDVTGGSLPYNPDDNVETCDSL